MSLWTEYDLEIAVKSVAGILGLKGAIRSVRKLDAVLSAGLPK